MWKIIEFIALAAIVLILITEFFYPILSGKPLFGSFRKSKTSSPKISETESLNEKINTAKEKVEEIKTVQNEVNTNFKTAEQLKDESDKLLNNNS